MTDIIEEIKQTILDGIPNAEIYIHDPLQDGIHLEATVISPDFREKSRVQQHQQVMRLLVDHFATSLHALSLKTMTPEQWETQKLNDEGQ